MNRHIFKVGLLSLLAAALLAAGCSKEARVPGLRIFEESMNGSAKVLVDPSNPAGNQWIAGESIGIYDFGTRSCNIQQDGSKFYVDYNMSPQPLVAWYPYDAINYYCGSFTPNSTDSVVMGFGLETDVIYRLREDGKLSVRFPMVAFANEYDQSLMFRHITGAVAFDVVNNTGAAQTIAYILADAQRNSTWVNLWPDCMNGNGFVCRRDGSIGYLRPCDESDGRNNRLYRLAREDGNAIILADGDTLHCILPIPVTAEATDFTFFVNNTPSNYIQMRTLTGMTIARNHMYNLPTFYLAD